MAGKGQLRHVRAAVDARQRGIIRAFGSGAIARPRDRALDFVARGDQPQILISRAYIGFPDHVIAGFDRQHHAGGRRVDLRRGADDQIRR